MKVFANEASSDDERFTEVEEMVSASLVFPRDRLATFVCSFGASDVSNYQIVGTRGDLVVNNAYEFCERDHPDNHCQGKEEAAHICQAGSVCS